MRVDETKVRKTAKAFGFEWTTHGRLQHLYRSEAALFEEFAHYRLPPTFFTGKRVLDAGCGMGRYSYVAAQLGATTVVGFDLHDGVQAAQRLTAPLGPVRVLRANIFAPPFRQGSFDAIMSIGVVHHTGDAHQAIRALTELLRPGGQLFLQVYASRGPRRDRWNARLLRLTTKLPPRLLYACAYGLVALMYVPVARHLLKVGLHYVSLVSYSPRRTFRRNVADTFDWHCAPYKSFHTEDELASIMQTCGLTRITVTNPGYRHGLTLLGEKPR
jgi:2-polyprenyl-3-methyl-5-hydroxy-6-metoxy-1,4-benzoquinol methylase